MVLPEPVGATSRMRSVAALDVTLELGGDVGLVGAQRGQLPAIFDANPPPLNIASAWSRPCDAATAASRNARSASRACTSVTRPALGLEFKRVTAAFEKRQDRDAGDGPDALGESRLGRRTHRPPSGTWKQNVSGSHADQMLDDRALRSCSQARGGRRRGSCRSEEVRKLLLGVVRSVRDLGSGLVCIRNQRVTAAPISFGTSALHGPLS